MIQKQLESRQVHDRKQAILSGVISYDGVETEGVHCRYTFVLNGDRCKRLSCVKMFPVLIQYFYLQRLDCKRNHKIKSLLTPTNEQFYNICILSVTSSYLFWHCRSPQGVYTKIS